MGYVGGIVIGKNTVCGMVWYVYGIVPLYGIVDVLYG